MKTIIILVLSVLLSTVCFAQIQNTEPGNGGIVVTDNPVGTIPGNFGVSPSGGAAYMIPLDLPSGRVGMKPEIAFSYNSQQKTGNILGQGWSLTGFSSITRTNPTLYYNGSNDNIDFDNDELILDGQHLIRVNEKEYRTELDIFSKIEEIKDGENGTYFKVYTKNGMIMEYGNTSDSRQVYSGNNSDNIPLAWHINNMTDRMGNRIDYSYIQDQQHGEVHPSSIYYSGDDQRTMGSTKISFTYLYTSIDDEIQHTSYFEKEGLPYLNSNPMLLEKIQISNDDGTKHIKDYVIGYYEQKGVCKEYFVKDITLVNYENGIASVIKPTSFGWNLYRPVYEENAVYEPGMIMANSSFQSIGLDLDGNHFDEIAVYSYKKDEFTGNYYKVVTLYGLNTGNIELNVTGTFHNFYAIDWDNNGDDELLVVDDDGIKIYNYNIVSGTLDKVYANSLVGSIYTGDITGDAINDLFIKQTTALLVLVGKHMPDGSFSYDLSPYRLSLSINQSIRTVADINGDGNAEILCKGSTNNSFSIWSFSVASGFTMVNDFNIAGWPTDQDIDVYYDDFNGDGKTDMCYLSKETNLTIRKTYFSYGNNFTEPKQCDFSNQEMPSVVTDINNDGRADFIYLRFVIGKLIMKYYFTKPDGISSESLQTSVECNTNFTAGKCQFNIANINANGTSGIILTSALAVHDPGPPHNNYDNLSIQTFADMGIGNNLIDTITDGFGVKTRIKYSNFGTSGPLDCNFPVAKPKFKDVVVSESYTLGDNNAKWNWKQYTFFTPLIHLQGKGFLGYKETQVVSLQNNILNISKNEVLIKNNKYFYLYPATSSTWSLQSGNRDKLLSETINTVDFKVATPGALNYLPVVVNSYTKSWDNDAAHSYKGIKITNQNIYDIDNYGNVSKYKILMDEFEVDPNPENSCAWEQTIVTSYMQADETLWLVSLPEYTETTTYHKPEEGTIDPTNITLSLYHYFQYGNAAFPLLEYKENIPNNNNDLLTQDWYTYDKYGNMTSETLKAKIDGATVERKTEYSYSEDDGYNGRFLTSKTLKAETLSNDQIITFTYDPITCRLLTSKDLNEVGTTTFEYDGMGKLKKTYLPDGTSNEIIVNWSALLTEFVPPPNALYYMLSFKNLNNAIYKWNKSFTFYDKYCRPLRSVTQGLNGDYIYIDDNYDNMGRILQVSEPYFSSGSPSLWTTSGYDGIGRLIKQTLPSGAIISTEFAGLTSRVTNTASGIWKETTVNVIGNADVVKDPTSGAITYNYDAASRIRSICTQGEPTFFEYDDAGNRTKVIDPDAGITLCTYNALGELVTQTDASGSEFTNTYDGLGRIETSSLVPDNTLTTYSYNGKSDFGFGQIKNVIKTINGSNETRIEYLYDILGRLKSKTNVIERNSYIFGYDYSTSSGMLEFYTYPSLYKIKYVYNEFGYMKNVIENSTSTVLWTANTANARGQFTDYNLGNGLDTHKEYDSYGFPSRITTKNSTTQIIVQDLNYDFDIFTGNLNSKTELIGSGYSLGETYEYDPILKSRLTSWQVQNGSPKYLLQYTDNGNILTKSDVTQATGSQYTYGNSAGPHAVTGITLPTAGYLASATAQMISYTGFNKVQQILQNDRTGMMVNSLSVEYGPDNQRIKSILSYDYHHTTFESKAKYFFDDFEIEVDFTTGLRQLHYLSANSGIFAIIEIKNNVTTPYYIHTDYLGNYNLITSGTGAKLETLSFDPWGRRRHPTNWSYTNVPTTFLFDRGYTGHEHLDKFGLINMNGRVFDPILARFLSPDPFLQDPSDSQSHNRYSYCLNNPLKYTDPSGYKPQFDPCSDAPVIWNPGGGKGSSWGGGGSIGPGSENHWSDKGNYRSSWGNFMLGSPFNNSYGNEKYNQLFNYYVTVRNNINSAINNKDPEQDKGAEYIDAGFTVTPIDAYGRKIYVASLGAPGNISTLPNGGIIFDNKTSSEVWALTIIISLSGGGNPWMNTVNSVIEGLGVVSGLFGGNYGLTAHQTVTYAERINGRVVSAAELTAAHTVQSLKVAQALGRLNVVTGLLGTAYSASNIIAEYQKGGIGNVNGLDVSDALVGGGGVAVGLFMATNPIGWGIGIGVGIYFGARLVYDLSKE